MSAMEIWNNVKEHFLNIKDVQKQGESLKIHRKMFAMFNKNEEFVLKLPKARVSELIKTGIGMPYDPGNGKIMKEWVIIPNTISEKWIEMANEAKNFAISLAK